MLRFSTVLTVFMVVFFGACGANAQGTGKTVWVGQHVYDLQRDYSSVVRDSIDRRFVEIRDRFDISPELKRYLDGHEVRLDPEIATATDDLIQHYNEYDKSTLLVTSGSGIGSATEMESGVYLGPRRSGFVVESARAKLLAVSSHQVADMYLRLLLHYVLIKDAVNSNMDYREVISPLREKALDLVHHARQAQPSVVTRIHADLLRLSQ